MTHRLLLIDYDSLSHHVISLFLTFTLRYLTTVYHGIKFNRGKISDLPE